MGGGAAGHGQASAAPPMDPAVLEHRREPRARVLPPRRGLQETATLPIPDELVAEIFLLLPPTDLVRASAACASFYRLVASRSFLRRFRKLHPPPLLGFLDDRVFHPVTPPYPSASAANAVALAADFSFSFLPGPARDWEVLDVRDGRVLLKRPGRQHPEMVVCDPLYRRYLLLPLFPDDLAASLEGPSAIKWRESFLVPAGDEEAATAEETSFRVIWMAQCKFRLFTFVFSSRTGQWGAVPSPSWSDLFAGLPSLEMATPLNTRQYAYGCFYWMAGYMAEAKMLVLDTWRMEFSVAESPPDGFAMAMVEAGEGRAGVFVHAHVGSKFSYSIRQNDGGSLSQWQEKKTVSLGYGYYIMGSTERYLFLYQLQSPLPNPGVFTLDVQTFQLERVCGQHLGHAYSNFPPSLLLSPTV
ncbi:hypothetical protein CFC21_091150 [Triticum aestivum]|uniref:F-box domain-containing protein n=2 Tax=Triticum aestivum TaxID=4565 RepID=A0A9R1LFT5_WHEAT|nr:uncharacterized protein LOC123143173 [Triticum aestivum]KAF7087991.1 hypothetical protein CFC21_091148 [Triticum aestivum]KAF7087993.1 hypothetical protein CFC21_091150 [Triticum aestivum]